MIPAEVADAVRSDHDHGSYEDAVRFALDVHDDHLQTWEFLNAWNHGDLDEWPEFYAWLDVRHPRQVPLITRLFRAAILTLKGPSR